MDKAFATQNKRNKATYTINQSRPSAQNAFCTSGGTTFLSRDNVSFQNRKNTAYNALT